MSEIVVYERILEGVQKGEFVEVVHPYAVVLSQDCDLDWDFKSRNKLLHEGQRSSGKEMLSVMFCLAHTAIEARAVVKGGDVWKRIVQNKDERYQFLELVPPNCDADAAGVPELVLDFKRYFAIPAPELYEQVASTAHRRSVMKSPYLEHLASRFANYQCRIALPADHMSVP